MKRALALLLASASLACGPAPVEVSSGSLSLAETVDCPSGLPDDLQAEVWQSGVETPTPLTIDESGAVTGSLEVATGINRRLVIDWYVERDEVRILLAQAPFDINLENPEGEVVSRDLEERDITVTGCKDVTNDLGRQGFPTISFNGNIVPPCDLDGDGGEPVTPAGSNLGELCVGADPLVADGG